jgi:hypothetical protein
MFLGSISNVSLRRDGKVEVLKSAQRTSPTGRLQLMMMSSVWRAGMVGSASSESATKLMIRTRPASEVHMAYQ